MRAPSARGLAVGLTLAGAIVLVAGVAVIWWPASLIVAGAGALAFGLLGIDVGGRR